MAYLLPDPKDPDAYKDYTWDWSRWLVSGEVIATVSVTTTPGLTLGPVQNDGKHVTVWVSGGADGQAYRLNCHVTTSAARTDDRAMILRVEDNL